MNTETITNVVTATTLDSTGSWTCNQSIPIFDLCIVRQITYSNAIPAPNVYTIDSNIGMIGTFVSSYNFESSPNSRIQNRGSSTRLTFKITRNNEPISILGEIGIHLEFIKYTAK